MASGRHVTNIEKLTELLLGCLVQRSDTISLDNEERSTIAPGFGAARYRQDGD